LAGNTCTIFWRHGDRALIISRAPVRISLLGGGTDYSEHFRQHGGQTLGLTIDRYSYITVNRLAPLFDYSIRVSYSRVELVNRVEDIAHPSVRECLRFLNIEGGLEIHYVGDLPARTGLGSSSSFTVALLHALHAYKGEHVTQMQLAAEAATVEHEWIRERVGFQDQYTCAHGGVVHLTYERDGRVVVNRLPLQMARLTELHQHLLLFYTGIRRNAHDVLDEQLERTKDGALTVHLDRLAELAAQGVELLTGCGPLDALGELLDDAWRIKRELSSKISNKEIDEAYGLARAQGAEGGKLLGAGGGGFLLLFAPPDRHEDIATALPGLPRVPFGFDADGSRLLFFQPE
jgi:D-glycero-alpha-D-manno-heptose-7-phosphate kinase